MANSDEKTAQVEREHLDADDKEQQRYIHHVPTAVMKHGDTADGDEALKAFTDYDGEPLVIDEATNKRLLRRIDMWMMPIMCIIYMLNFLDKTAISYASIMGMEEDLNLVGNEYEWLGSLFYFGYLGWEYPTNRLLQRLPVGKYSAFNVIMWGGTLACFAAVTNFSGAVAVRYFLGMFESAVTPGFAYITSQWYTKKEQGFRVSIWFSFNGIAQIVGGVVAYGIDVGVAKNGSSLAPWKIVFLVIGLFTFAVGILYFFIVPDNQLNARFLNKRDRVLAVERIRSNEQGVGNKHFKMYQFKEALTDPQTWLFVAYSLLADIPNGGITNFFSQLIVSFGYTPAESLLWGTPGGAVEVVTIVSWGLASYYYGNRLILASFSLALAVMGIVMIVAIPLDNPHGRLAGYYFTQASATPFVAILSLISTNVAGYTKKTTVGALYLIAYCVGNIIGPQTFVPSDKPHYVPAEITIIVCWSICLVLLYVIVFYYRLMNAKKARIRAEPGYQKLANQEFLDLTDRENPEFVYSL